MVTNEQATKEEFFFVIPFYLQSVKVHSANCVKMYTMERRRGFGSALLQLRGTKPVVTCGKETYKLNLKDYTTKRQLNLESGRQIIWHVSLQSPVIWLHHEVHY
jgi:hypothetical protein